MGHVTLLGCSEKLALGKSWSVVRLQSEEREVIGRKGTSGWRLAARAAPARKPRERERHTARRGQRAGELEDMQQSRCDC